MNRRSFLTALGLVPLAATVPVTTTVMNENTVTLSDWSKDWGVTRIDGSKIVAGTITTGKITIVSHPHLYARQIALL